MPEVKKPKPEQEHRGFGDALPAAKIGKAQPGAIAAHIKRFGEVPEATEQGGDDVKAY